MTDYDPDSLANALPTQAVAAELRRIIKSITAAYPELTDPWDPEWRSPCEIAAPRAPRSGSTKNSTSQGDSSGMEVPWLPCPRPALAMTTLFEPLERALETDIHPDIKTYYGSYYSGGLETNSAEGPVSLLQLWNDDDTTRLIENLLGHALAKQRAKAPYSVFFALTEVNSEMFLAVENHTGHVLLERPGYKPERTIAGSLAEFLRGLTPAPPERHPERAAFLLAQQLN